MHDQAALERQQTDICLSPCTRRVLIGALWDTLASCTWKLVGEQEGNGHFGLRFVICGRIAPSARIISNETTLQERCSFFALCRLTTSTACLCTSACLCTYKQTYAYTQAYVLRTYTWVATLCSFSSKKRVNEVMRSKMARN
jgi:hypothetical protein